MSGVSLTDATVRRRQVRALLTAGSVAVVAVGLVTQVVLHRGDRPAPEPLAPGAAFSVLDRPQEARDVVPAGTFDHTVRAGSTRYLGTTARGRFFLGVGLTGDACLLSVADVAEAGCTPFPADRETVVQELRGQDGSGARLVPDGFVPPAGWEAVSENLLVRRS